MFVIIEILKNNVFQIWALGLVSQGDPLFFVRSDVEKLAFKPRKCNQIRHHLRLFGFRPQKATFKA
jgi:hypothetical protein